MKLRLAAPASLASAPLQIMVRDSPHRYSLALFTDHDAALSSLAAGEYDILCTGFTEARRSAVPLHRIATFLWGLSAVLVTDRALTDLRQVAQAGVPLYLPFAGSPLDLQVRALLSAMRPVPGISLVNANIAETAQGIAAGIVGAAVLPEPIAAAQVIAGKAFRLGDLSQLWSEIFAESRTPQVSAFCCGPAHAYQRFIQDLEVAIGLLNAPDETGLNFLSGQLATVPPVLREALQHALFALPSESEAWALETAYTKILYSGGQ